MAEFDLPEGPAEILEAVRRPLGRILGGEQNMNLGGGTALSARWRHRSSTDVDLFVDDADFKPLFAQRERFRIDLENQAPDARSVIIRPAFAVIVLASGGEISITTSPDISPARQKRELFVRLSVCRI